MTWLIIALLAALAAWPFIAETRRTKIGRAERQGAPGGFAKLSQGVTYYRWFGPARGPVILAVHGLTTPSVVFEDIAEGLGAFGYRVLTYDLYGRGLSDAPRGAQTAQFFHQQIDELLADQDVGSDLTMIGYSMGGSIASTYAAAQSDRINRLILLASAGVDIKESSFDRFCRTTPILGDWLFMAFAPRRMAMENANSAGMNASPNVQSALQSCLSRQGYAPAVLSSRRGMLADRNEAAHREIGRLNLPVIALWGAEDEVIPLTALGQLSQWNRNTAQEVIEGANHAFPISHAQDVVSRLGEVLRERD